MARQLATHLFEGRVGDWRELGEPPAPLRLILGPYAQPIPVTSTKGEPLVKTVSTDEAVVAAVERDFGAAGIVRADAVGPTVRALSVDGQSPLRQPNTYPFSVPGPAPGTVVTAMALGDIMLARGVYGRMLETGDWAGPLRPTAARIAASDLAFANYEGTVSCRGPLSHTPPGDALATDVRALAAPRLAGINVLTIANNHTGDFGASGIIDTVERIRKAGFLTTGAGADLPAAAAPVIVIRRGVRFGFLAFNATGESPAAGPHTPGVVSIGMPPYSPLNRGQLEDFLARVRALRARVDVLVVVPHWGPEYDFFPVAAQRDIAHQLVDAGTDLVIGTHPHWMQGVERYGRGFIAYSLGNFVFDQTWAEETRESIALEMTFWGRTLKAVELVPARIGDDYAPRFLPWSKAGSILGTVWGASGQPWRLQRAKPSAQVRFPTKRIPLGAPCR